MNECGQLGKTGLYGFNDTLICVTSYPAMYDLVFVRSALVEDGISDGVWHNALDSKVTGGTELMGWKASSALARCSMP